MSRLKPIHSELMYVGPHHYSKFPVQVDYRKVGKTYHAMIRTSSRVGDHRMQVDAAMAIGRSKREARERLGSLCRKRRLDYYGPWVAFLIFAEHYIGRSLDPWSPEWELQ